MRNGTRQRDGMPKGTLQVCTWLCLGMHVALFRYARGSVHVYYTYIFIVEAVSIDTLVNDNCMYVVNAGIRVDK
jgi:hypothetical protein